MSICNECWGKGWIEKQGVQFDCRKCKGTGVIENEPQTNEEWRKTCSTEEFAEWISNLAYACMRCGMSNGEAYCRTGYCIQDEADAEKWLKEKHNESV